MVLARFLGGLNTLGAMERQSLCFLRLRAEGIGVFIADKYFKLGGGGAMALGIVSIYLTDPGWKVKDSFQLCNNSLPDALVQDIFLTAVLLGLDTDAGP